MKFTIRDVLWMTMVVGLSVALWLEHRSVVVERLSLKAERERLADEHREMQRNRALLARSAQAINDAILRQKKSEEASRP